jgi:hypothetical protein
MVVKIRYPLSCQRPTEQAITDFIYPTKTGSESLKINSHLLLLFGRDILFTGENSVFAFA